MTPALDLMPLASEGTSICMHTLHPRHTQQNINLYKTKGEGEDQYLRVSPLISMCEHIYTRVHIHQHAKIFYHFGFLFASFVLAVLLFET